MTNHDMVRLGDVCDAIPGFELDRALISDDPSGVPAVLPSDIDEGDAETYYSGDYDEDRMVDAGEYLVSMSDGLNIEEWYGPKSVYSEHLCKLVPNEHKLNPRYMYYALTYIFSKIEDEEDADLVINNVSINELLDTVIPLPDIEEQELIVDVLENAQELLELQIEQMQTIDQLVVARFIEMFGDVETNSMGWDIKPLGEISERLSSRSILDKERRPGNIPYYDSTGVVDFIDESLYDEELLLVAKVGPVLTSDDRSVAHVVRGKIWASDLVHVLRLNDEVVPEFVEMVINNLDFSHRLRGGIMPKLATSALKELPIPCPPIEMPIEYAAFLKMIDEQGSAMQGRLENYAQICRSLNQRYFESSMSYE